MAVARFVLGLLALSALGAAAQSSPELGSMRPRFARERIPVSLEPRDSVSCPATSQLSCHNTTVPTNLCCFNSPGGALLQTQFWDTDPVVGPSDSWTIHGLWVWGFSLLILGALPRPPPLLMPVTCAVY